jgi:hypothetical protein
MKFIYDAPALFHKKALIVGDTHFGMEDVLRKKGIHAGDFSERLGDKLESLIKKLKPERLILLGDVKEEITFVDKFTMRILTRLSALCKVEIARGNHDGGLDLLDLTIHPSEGFVFGKLGLAHGHSWPGAELMQCEYLVLGHQHPLFGWRDRSGKYHSEPVFAIAPPVAEAIKEHYPQFNQDIKLILLPAFNPLVGSPINSHKNRRLGPVLNKKLFKLDHALLYRLDGLPLGELKNIGD